jgi:hypothetical protein
VQGDEQGCDLDIGAFSRENFGHHLARLFSREGLMVIGDRVQGVNNHAGNPRLALRQKLPDPEFCRAVASARSLGVSFPEYQFPGISKDGGNCSAWLAHAWLASVPSVNSRRLWPAESWPSGSQALPYAWPFNATD